MEQQNPTIIINWDNHAELSLMKIKGRGNPDFKSMDTIISLLIKTYKNQDKKEKNGKRIQNN